MHLLDLFEYLSVFVVCSCEICESVWLYMRKWLPVILSLSKGACSRPVLGAVVGIVSGDMCEGSVVIGVHIIILHLHMEEEKSALGSPNIFLKKNLERRHIYRGIYVIKEAMKEKFRQGSPIPHLKIRYSLYKQIIEGLNDLARIAKASDESCEIFTQSMEENFGVTNMEKAAIFANRMILCSEFGGTVLFLSDTDIDDLKSYLLAYLKLYIWSINDDEEYKEKRPYYPHERYSHLNLLLKHIKIWEVTKEIQLNIPS
jgi:hypothetical protein